MEPKRARKEGTLLVVFEDDDILVVVKPAGMLAVPGREAQLLSESAVGGATLTPRAEQWVQSMRRAKAEAVSRSGVPREVLKVLEALVGCSSQQLQNIPRKREQFMRYLQRARIAADPPLFEQVWALLQEVDGELHRPRYEAIPSHLVSAADIAAAQSNLKKVLAVHRLDMETSGLLIFAKTDSACADLCRQFREHLVEKRYLALVDGSVAPSLDGSAIKLPLSASPDPALRPRQVVDMAQGKASETLVRVLHRFPAPGESDQGSEVDSPNQSTTTTTTCSLVGSKRALACSPDQLGEAALCTLLELTPLTGRTHQLRVHCAAVGHPILGDTLYHPDYANGSGLGTGTRPAGSSGDGQYSHTNLCLHLHAQRVRFRHPVTGLAVELEARCPFFANH